MIYENTRGSSLVFLYQKQGKNGQNGYLSSIVRLCSGIPGKRTLGIYSVCQVVNHFCPGLFFSLKFYIFGSNKKEIIMTQIVLTIPNEEVSFLSTLAEKMGWSFQTSENLVEKFIASCPTDISISDEEIQAEVNAVRYGR